MINEEYPNLYENNDEYFKNLISRIFVAPEKIRVPYKKSPLQCLNPKMGKNGTSSY